MFHARCAFRDRDEEKRPFKDNQEQRFRAVSSLARAYYPSGSGARALELQRLMARLLLSGQSKPVQSE